MIENAFERFKLFHACKLAVDIWPRVFTDPFGGVISYLKKENKSLLNRRKKSTNPQQIYPFLFLFLTLISAELPAKRYLHSVLFI